MSKFKSSLYSALGLITMVSCGSEQQKKEQTMQPPVAKKVAKELIKHDHTRIDNYFWMNQREDPEVIAHLEAENAYTDEQLADTKNFQTSLYDEMRGRIKEDDSSVPYFENGYFYYSRNEEGKEYTIYCRKNGSMDAEEEILLNGNEMAEGHEYFSVGGLTVSDDNKMLAYGVDTVSRRLYTIYFKNLETGEISSESIPSCSGGGAWAADNTTFFYTIKNGETLRTERIRKHKLGSDVASDVEVFYEEDDTYSTYVWRTKSKAYIFIASYQTLASEFRMIDATAPDGEFSVIQPREKDHEYDVSHYEDKFYIRTNLDAKNFKLVSTSVSKPGKENWKDVIPHRDETLFEGVEIFKDHMVLDERTGGLTTIRIIDQKDKSEHFLDFGEAAYTAYVGQNAEFNTTTLRFGYSSMTTPWSTYDYDMNTKEKNLMKEQPVLGGFNKADYQTERVMATADDGTEVPISIVYKKGMKKDGTSPTLLYAYGSYGATMDAYFSSARLSLLDRGFVYAIAHIRGGQEMGRHWYEDGKLLNKKNTFTDFIDCGEFLIEQGYSAPDKLYAMGGSAGGLLMGAIINIKPEIWAGIVAAVPFVDVISTMLDETIPLTTSEYDEWGNPNVKEYYDYILTYSPYDNVEAKAYPNMLVTTGLHDSQVQYWEPAKWVAKLREMKTDDNVLLLHTNMEAGHGGASGRFEALKETAMEYAFFFKLAGITE
ncbi:MAG: oligopeptidase B [Bacteroidia bacterium]|jgi:oligopeptidase B